MHRMTVRLGALIITCSVILLSPASNAALTLSPWSSTSTPGSFQLVGHSPLRDRGMNAALAVAGRYAYIGSRTDATHPNAGVLVVAIMRPVHPTVVGAIGPPAEDNRGETSRELRVWPQQHLLIVENVALSLTPRLRAGCHRHAHVSLL